MIGDRLELDEPEGPAQCRQKSAGVQNIYRSESNFLVFVHGINDYHCQDYQAHHRRFVKQ